MFVGYERPLTPLYWLTCGLLLGQGAASAGAGPALRWAAVSAAFAAYAVGGWRGRARSARPTRMRCDATAPPHRTAARLLSAALLAAAVGQWQVDRILHPTLPADHIRRFAGGRAVVRGRIAERPLRRPGGVRLLVAVTAARRGGDWQAAQGLVLVTLDGAALAWQRGDGIEAIVKLRRPHNFGNPGEFDFESYLARRGVFATAFAASDAGWNRTAPNDGWGRGLERWRDAVVRTIETTIDPAIAPIVGALLVGDAIPLPSDVRDRYARAGVSHVLSISGLHVALVAGAAYGALRWLLARSERALLFASVPKLAMAGSLVPLGLYAAIAGADVATIRADIMGVLVVAAMLLNRPRDWLAPLASAALTISLYAPGALCEISFQLSFIAILAIAFGMRRISAWWAAWEDAHLVRLRGPHWRWVRWAVLSQAVTLCAVVGTAPLTAWHFNQLSPIAFIANPLVVPLLGVGCVGAGLIATAAVPLAPSVAAGLFRLVGAIAGVADTLVRLCAAVPGGSVQVVTPSPLELALLYAALVALVLPQRGARRVLLAVSLLCLTVDAAAWAHVRWWRDDLQITFVSVGQGDCAVVEFPGSAVMVVDGGGLAGEFEVGRQVVAPFLWRRKIAHVDTLALSHPDFDHFGGLTYLAAAFSPDAFWWNGTTARGVRYEALWQALRSAGVAALAVHDGFARTIGGVEVRAVHPAMDASGTDNDRSLTLYLRYGPTAVLLPGDVEAAGERAMVRAHGAALRATVLKVPHHGSRTSSSAPLLDAVEPRLAIISVGADNRFRFPHPAVLDAYRRRGVEVWRTDRDGAVTVRVAADGAISIATGRAPEAFQP